MLWLSFLMTAFSFLHPPAPSLPSTRTKPYCNPYVGSHDGGGGGGLGGGTWTDWVEGGGMRSASGESQQSQGKIF